MPDLLLELFSEEIPARMQAKAADDLRRMVTDKLVAEGLVYDGAKAFATPRRLALTVHGIPARQPDLKDERKGPKIGAPDAAVQGFLKAAGLKSLDEAKIQRDPKKGDFYVALIEKPGRPAIDVIAEILPVIIRTFPWPKQMRWGERSAKPGALTWVRPLHSIIATFGLETEEPDVVGFDVSGITAGQTTRGHRFMAPGEISVRRFEDYEAKLQAAKVVLDPQRRKDIVLADAKELAFAQGFELVEDQVLLDEVSGLVEWPVVLMGSFDQEFLSIPAEVIRATIRNNQKCFVVRQASSPLPADSLLPPPLRGRVGEGGKPQGSSISSPPPPTPPRKGEGRATAVVLAPKFILTANIEASDDGKAIVAGNERVIRARLSDAKFFYETDLKNWKDIPLDQRLKRFDGITFHQKLGSQGERIARIERLAAEIAPLVGADVAKAKRAARLCKADLLTEVVGEFPELQGLMGKYYALAQGEDASVAAASEDHYKPQGPNDRVPSDPVSIAVALADKIDTLVGFWAIDEKPTGSKDPYALRRAALGVIRLILDGGLRLTLAPLLSEAFDKFYHSPKSVPVPKKGLHFPSPVVITYERIRGVQVDKRAIDLLSFFADRLKVQLREQGARHDLVDAVFAAGELPPPLRGRVGEGGEPQAPSSSPPPPPTPPRRGEGSLGSPASTQQDDLLMIVRRVEALGKFLETDDGKNLLAGTKRASNILSIEEKKDGEGAFNGAPNRALLHAPEEQALDYEIRRAKVSVTFNIKNEDFEGAMENLARLRPAVDAFFDKVKVNDEDPKIRENRLKLLNEIRAATRAVADFSKIQD